MKNRHSSDAPSFSFLTKNSRSFVETAYIYLNYNDVHRCQMSEERRKYFACDSCLILYRSLDEFVEHKAMIGHRGYRERAL